MNPEPTQTLDRPDRPSQRYAWWVVAVLVISMIVAYIDRQIISVLAQEMRNDLHFSDTQVSSLHAGFAIFYALAGYPIAWIIDRYRRRETLAIAIAFWTLMTVLSGTTKNFFTLFLYRVGVGAGEATINPAAHSWAGAVIERRHLPLALSLVMLGPVIGSGVGFYVGGLALEILRPLDPVSLPIFGKVFAWQLAYFYVGLPGLLVILLLYTLKEPKRTAAILAPKAANPERSEVFAFYKREWATLACHHLGFTLLVLMGNAFVFWSAAWFERIHGVPSGQAGRWIGILFLVPGVPAVILAAVLAQRVIRARGGGGILATAAVGAAGLVLSVGIVQLMPDARSALIAYVPAFFFLNMPYGLAQGALPLIAPEHMRARVAAIYAMVYSVGTAIGPAILGLVSDNVFPGANGIRDAMLLVCTVFGTSAIALLWIGRNPYTRTFERAEAEALAAER